MTTPVEVTVTAADYWASRSAELMQLLTRAASTEGSSAIADPTGRPPDPENIAIVVAPAEWASYPRELQEALGRGAASAPNEGNAAGAIAPVGERLTLTVEEAATLLGISRAFAYEAVNAGTIPSIRIGRRILVPKAALNRMLSGPGENEGAPAST